MNFEMFLYISFLHFLIQAISFEMLNSTCAVVPFVYINVGSLSVMVPLYRHIRAISNETPHFKFSLFN